MGYVKNISEVAHMHNRRIVGHDICYSPTRMVTVTGSRGSMETAAMCVVNVLLHPVVFQIISIPTYGKE